MIKKGEIVFVQCADTNYIKSESLVGKIGVAIDFTTEDGRKMVGIDFGVKIHTKRGNLVTHNNFLEDDTGYWLTENTLKVIEEKEVV
jgi:hypothetical protein